jgi:hypothetical protein
MDHIIIDGREVDDLTEGITDLVLAITQAEQAKLVIAKLCARSASQRKNGISDLDSELAGSRSDRGDGHFLDPINDRETERTAGTIETAEEQNRDRPWAAACRTIGDPRSALLRFELNAADFGQPGGVEQQDRTSVIGEGRSGVKASGHDRRGGRLHDQLFMIVNAVD